MTLDQLRQFCSTDKYRWNLLHPWTEGEWSFATDGKLIVMVPVIDGAVAPQGTNPPDGTGFLKNAQALDDSLAWTPFADCQRGDEITCRYCRVECAACGGEGDTGDCGCEACECQGWVLSTESCAECHDIRKIAGYQCGVAIIDPWLIRNLVQQPALRFIPAVEKRKPVLFCFDGGYSFVMPIWKEAYA